MAGPTVTTTIRIVGDDRASATIAGVGKALDGAAKSASSMASTADHAAEKAGDLERGFRGVKDILGTVGGEQLQSLTDKFGGIEAIIKGFGPKLGVAGLAIAGVAAGVAYWYEQQEKVRKATLDTQIEAIKHAKGDIDAQAARLHVAAELLGKKREELTVEGVIAEAKDRANKIDDLRIQSLEAQKEKQDEKVASLNTEIAALQSALAYDGQRLERAKELARERDLAAGLAVRDTTREAVEQARIAGIMDQRERLQAQALDVARRRRQLENDQLIIQDQIRTGAKSRLDLENQLNGIVKARLGLDAEERRIAAEGQARADAARAKAEAAAAAAAARRKARAAEAAKFDEELEQNRKEIALRAREIANEAYAAEKQQRADRQADEARIRAAAITAAGTPEQSFVLRMIDLEIQERQQLEAAKEQFAGNDEARALRESAIIAETANRRRAVQAAELERVRTMTVAQGARFQREADESRAAQDRARAEREQQIGNALAIANAVAGAAEMMGASEREVAGLRALISAADAIRLAYEQQYARAALAAIAAVQYGYIASGGGRSSGAGAASTASAGMTEAGSEKRALAGGGGGGGGNVIIHYNKPFYGSSQENAKGIAGTLKSLRATGFGSYKGA